MSQNASVCPKRSISVSSAAGFVCQREQIFLIRSSKAHHSVLEFKKKLAYREDGSKRRKAQTACFRQRRNRGAATEPQYKINKQFFEL